MKILTVLISLAAFALSAANLAAEVVPAKYVFLFIGDGMSIPQRMMTERYLKLSGKDGLEINKFKNQAITYTSSANSFITDSAASGTAIACGEKTNNGIIGQSPKGDRLESIAEVAKKSGRRVGIATSVTINHATPAAFYGHNASRGNYYALALDMIESNFDYFGGGGVNENNKKKVKGYKGDIYELAQKAGYKVSRDADSFKTLKAGDGKIMAFGAPAALPYAIDNADGLRLADFVRKGIELLDNDKGFFMMAEGGKIDWMCHANDAATVIKEVIDFDNAVRVACDFARAHPNDTMIVVTGDHETGGLTLGFAGTGYTSFIDRLALQKCSLDVFKNKLKALKKSKGGKITFEDAKPVVEECFSLKFGGDSKDPMTVSAAEEKKLAEAFAEQKTFSRAVAHCFANKAGVGWTTGAHTALPVNTTAFGKNAENFTGAIDNTDISKMLKKAVR